jgi:hypothetical protein
MLNILGKNLFNMRKYGLFICVSCIDEMSKVMVDYQ